MSISPLSLYRPLISDLSARYFGFLFFFLLFLFSFFSVTHAMKLEYYNHFIEVRDPFPTQSTQSLVPISIKFTSPLESTAPGSETPPINSTPLVESEFKLLKDPLVSPSPMSFSQDTQLGFGFLGAGTIEFKFFDMFGTQIAQHIIDETTLKVNQSYETYGDFTGKFYSFPINRDLFNGIQLPSGPYFFLMIQGDRVLHNGTFLVSAS
ncbi:MAG: hypothetical protein CL521_05795 [Actinobacteria bacterium]|nr:hypothetical protein [Actinomycetota bacterium]